jgi:hypothetical protein
MYSMPAVFDTSAGADSAACDDMAASVDSAARYVMSDEYAQMHADATAYRQMIYEQNQQAGQNSDSFNM